MSRSIILPIEGDAGQFTKLMEQMCRPTPSTEITGAQLVATVGKVVSVDQVFDGGIFSTRPVDKALAVSHHEGEPLAPAVPRPARDHQIS